MMVSMALVDIWKEVNMTGLVPLCTQVYISIELSAVDKKKYLKCFYEFKGSNSYKIALTCCYFLSVMN